MKYTDKDVLADLANDYEATTALARRWRAKADNLARERAYSVYTAMVDTGSTQADVASLLGVSESHVQAMVRKARELDIRRLSFYSPEQQGRWVKELRTRAGMSLRDLAKRARVTQKWLRELESGQAAMSSGVIAVFDALDFEPENYVGRGG